MYKKLWKKVENVIPQIIGTIIVITGILHIILSVFPIFKLPTTKLDDLTNYLQMTDFQSFGVIIGICLGFLLIFLGRGIYNRKRRAWILTIIVILILFFYTYFVSSLFQTCYLTLGLLVILLLFAKLFHYKSDSTTLTYQNLMAWVSVIFAFAYGIIGSYLLRSQFFKLDSWADAAYFTLVTYSTVGYGDILPVTYNAKIFTITMILIGVGSFVTAFTLIIGPMIENRIKGVLTIMKRINNIHDHVILCGYTSLTKSLIKSFKQSNTSFMVLANSPDKIAEINQENYITIAGNTHQKSTFENSRIKNAKSVICTFESDAENILTILTVSEILKETGNKTTKLISRIDDEENIDKAKKLGVSHIVSPTEMAASCILNINKDCSGVHTI